MVLELDAKLLEPHGGLSVGFEMLSNYEGFVDLGSQLMQVIPTSQLKVFYRISRETGASYDLLFLPRKSGNQARPTNLGRFSAEDGGFEPPRAFTQHAFQACAIGH